MSRVRYVLGCTVLFTNTYGGEARVIVPGRHNSMKTLESAALSGPANIKIVDDDGGVSQDARIRDKDGAFVHVPIR